MAAVSEEEQRAARTKVVGALGVFGLVLIAVIVGLIWAGHQTSSGGPAAPAGNGGTAPAAADGQAQAGGWDVAGETALAAAPMRQFPDSAAMPQTIATTSLPLMNVPAATRANPAGVGEGFPATPEGAIGQLAAMETDALADLSPQTFGAAYASISAPGAPAPESTPLGTQVASVTEQLGGSGPPITSRWQLAGAQVKGVTDGGRAVVVCVAGDLQIAQASTGEAGTGDCQAMRWNGNDWRIAPVPAPAQAPITWPGSAAFTQAGYHPTNGGPSS